MNSLLSLNIILFTAISVTALAVAVLWAVLSKGLWAKTLTGWSLMGLLMIIASITGNAMISVIWRNYDVHSVVYTIMYGFFEVVLIAIGVSLWRVNRDAKKRKARIASISEQTESEGV